MTSPTAPKKSGQARITRLSHLALTFFRSKTKSEKRRSENLAEKAGTASEAVLKRVCLSSLCVSVLSHDLFQNEVIRKCALDYTSLIRFMQVMKAMEPETFDLVRVCACVFLYVPNPNSLGSFPTQRRSGSIAARTPTWSDAVALQRRSPPD